MNLPNFQLFEIPDGSKSNTTFKNFRLSEMPDYFILKFDTTPLLKYLKNDVYGNEKYIDIKQS